jgi:hypothetical protein
MVGLSNHDLFPFDPITDASLAMVGGLVTASARHCAKKKIHRHVQANFSLPYTTLLQLVRIFIVTREYSRLDS